MKNNKKTAKISAFALTLALMLSNCSIKKSNDKLSFSELLDIPEVANVTVIDEVEDDFLVYGSKMDLEDVADYLDKGITILDVTKRFKTSDEELIKVDDSTKADIIRLVSLDEVLALIEDADVLPISNDKKRKKEEAIKQLGIIYSCYKEWFVNEGLDNITILLEDVLRGSISAETGVAMNRISHLKRDEKTMKYYFVVAGKKYELYTDPELFNPASFIFENKEIDDISFNKVISNCKMGLQFGKVALAAGANVRNDSLQAQYTKKYISNNFGLK